MPVASNPIKRYAIILGAVWTVVAIGSFTWSYSQQKANVIEIAKSEARIAIQKDTLYRKWAAKHGGVYVPATQATPPNPYLPTTIERDIITPSGKALTLMNPAYMTRQVFEMAAEGTDLVRGHITSLNPIRQQNAPDSWEREALKAFEKGTTEINAVQTMDGQPYLRLMRPFITDQPCLKCHAAQGYKSGDIRGGISVSVPLSVLSPYSDRIIAGTGAAHGLIWLLGIGLIGFGSRKLSRNAAELSAKNYQLEEEISERQMAQEALQDQAVMLEEEIAERVQAEAAIRHSEEKFSKSFQNAPLMMAISILEDGTFLDVNNKFVELSGYSREETIGATSLKLGWINAADRSSIVEECQRNGRVSGRDLYVYTKDARQLITLYYGELFPMEGQTRLLSIYLDVTEQRKVESQLLHSQKMEAIGTLAGGMAHDVNNVLTVISGYASLLSMRFTRDSDESAMADEIVSSVDRAAEMTRSLLAFSRKEPMHMKPEDINKVISALEKSMKRLIREDIEFTCSLSAQPILVMADKGQLEQVIVNLVVNARDAMPSGGSLSITSTIAKITVGEHGVLGAISPGEYGVISVSDTGFGMDQETREQIFEPFFTTKETNKGTGLGLSIVHGIISKHQGAISVSSEKGHGTTFSVYLPLLDQPQQAAPLESRGQTPPGGNETILLVDDDQAVRQITTKQLEIFGYNVLFADNGETALALFRDNRDSIRLLITDVIMPRKNGRELYEEITKINSNIPAIFISGYSADILEDKEFFTDKVIFIAKPIKPDLLLVAVRQMLDTCAS